MNLSDKDMPHWAAGGARRQAADADAEVLDPPDALMAGTPSAAADAIAGALVAGVGAASDDLVTPPVPPLPPINMLRECRSVEEFERQARISEGTYGVVYLCAPPARVAGACACSLQAALVHAGSCRQL